MPDLLDRIREELNERLQAGQAAVREYERLQSALAALDGSVREDQPVVSVRRAPRPGSVSERRSGVRSRAASPPRKRAPRGQNRERVLSAVRDRAGVTALELAAVTGVKGGTLYALLRRLVVEGALDRRELPGGDTGYVLLPDEQPT